MRPGFSLKLLLLCFLTATAVGAQESRGTITGTVIDSSKAVIPGAAVTVTNVERNTSVTAITNAEGFFQVPYLIPGAYRITVELSGFKKLVREGIQVSVDDRLRLELPLEVGAAEEAITVTAETPLLETTSASLGQVIDARRVAELPIPHGDPYSLIGLAAGTSFMRSARLDRPFEPTHIVGYAMNGVRSNRSDVTIDGLPSTSTANAGEITASFVPPQGLVQEFKVQTATFDASLGNTEGGVTNLVLKSGTNKFSGEAYFVKTPEGLWANDFFANANNIPLADFRYTRWSAVAGGPVVIPGIYNGRNKTFFIYGYETLPEARPRNNGTPTVPSERMRNGDFSELLALGPQYQIYNPFTRRAIGGGRFQLLSERDPARVRNRKSLGRRPRVGVPAAAWVRVRAHGSRWSPDVRAWRGSMEAYGECSRADSWCLKSRPNCRAWRGSRLGPSGPRRTSFGTCWFTSRSVWGLSSSRRGMISRS